MRTSVTRYLEVVALAGALALAAAAAAAASFAQIRTEAEGTGRMSQYCVPQDDGLAAQRIYCRVEPG